jgi:hypothetical protein
MRLFISHPKKCSSEKMRKLDPVGQNETDWIRRDFV